MTKALRVIHDQDPKDEIWKEVKEFLPDFEPIGAQVLVCIYLRPGKTAGGILLAEETLGEDVYQGKVGLILKCGPLAFKEDATHQWGGVIPQVNDWVVYRIGDTFPCVIGKKHCRFIEDVNVRAILKQPDIVH